MVLTADLIELLEILFQMPVQITVEAIRLIIELLILPVGMVGNPDTGKSGKVLPRPEPRRNPGHKSGSVYRSHVSTLYAMDVGPQDVCGDLPPNSASRPLVDGQNPADGIPHISDQFRVMAEAVNNRLQNGTMQMVLRMVQTETEDNTARQRIEDRCFFPEEIRQYNEPFTAGRDLTRPFVQCGVGVLAASKKILEPFDDRAAGGHASADDILSRKIVIIDKQGRVRDELIQAVQDVAGPAEFQDQVSGVGDSRCEGCGNMISGTGDVGVSRGRPVCFSTSAVEGPMMS